MMSLKEVTFERTYNAPLAVIWQSWTDPNMLKEWWGPDNVSIPECEVDLRVGGEVYIVMEAGEAMGTFKGTRWPMRGTYTVVDENTKLSYTARAWTEGYEATTEIDQLTELVMFEEDGKTKLSVKVTINQVGPDAGMAIQGMEMGFNQQFDKLERYLER